MTVLRNISLTLFAVHVVPNCGILLVAPDVVILGRNEQDQAKGRHGDESLVAVAIVRLVVIAVNLHDRLVRISFAM